MLFLPIIFLLKEKVLPGDRLLLFTKLITFKRGIAEIESVGKVNNEIACKAIFKIVAARCCN